MIGQEVSTELPLAGLECFVESFINSREEELVLMRKALADFDFSIVLSLAHQWKGYSAPYGFGKLEGLARQLEQSAHSAQVERCEELLSEVDQYLICKKSYLDFLRPAPSSH